MARNAKKDGLDILICLIEIWEQGSSKDLSKVPDCPKMLTEVSEIEIEESYKNLFSKATVSFPRGTIIRETVTSDNVDQSQVTVDLKEDGVLVTKRVNTRRASVDDFKTGQRIRIYLGYTDNTTIAEYGKTSSRRSIYNDMTLRRQYIAAMASTENGEGSALMFDGYITKCSIDEPITLECEDLASSLKKITCPKIAGSQNWTVNDFLADDGKWKLLEKSGLKLHPTTKKKDINLGKTSVPDNLTVADVLTTWAKKANLYAFVRPDNDGYPCLQVGMAYFSKADKDSLVRDANPVDIDFSYHVANNGLTMMNTDRNFVAVTAECWESAEGGGKKYSITVRKNPEYDSSDPNSQEFQVLNETRLSKKAMKAGATSLTNSNDKIDLSSYTIIPYVSPKIGCTHEELKDEACKYLQSYGFNGVEGTLTLFGDFNLKSATKVHLRDDRFNAKNGYYLVGEVVTKFGVDGYRQTIKLPYCISRDRDQNKKDNG